MPVRYMYDQLTFNKREPCTVIMTLTYLATLLDFQTVYHHIHSSNDSVVSETFCISRFDQNCSRVKAPHPSGYHYRGIEHEYSEEKLHQTNKVYPHVLIIIVNCK